MTTPDSITTARKLLAAEYRSHGAIIYAEELEAGREEGTEDLVHTTHSLRAISKLASEIEKLKAERDEAQKAANNAVKSAHGHAVNLNKIITAVLPRGPMCRDCADEDGSCPHNDGLPCDPYDEVVERFRRLTSQLEQAEKVIAPLVDENEAQVEERSASVKDSDRPYMFYRATYADLAALSQWIKDRQAKGEG